VTSTSVDVVEVRAWGRTVGAVALDPATEFYAFEYDDEWVANGQQLAPLLMPNQPGTFVFPDLSPETYQRLPAMIADHLPDRFGNALVNAWMEEQGVRAGDITPLDRLAYAADRSMGALEFRPPASSPSEDVTALQLADLVTAARSAVVGDLASAPKDALHELIQVGTSAGGARAKAVVAYNRDTSQLRTGQLDAPEGFEHWLIKLDGVGTDPSRETDAFTSGAGYGLIEFAYSLMASAAGVTMAECMLLPEGPRTHFMTRRFDRLPDGGRVHLQSLCGLAGLDFNLSGAHSYAQYLGAIDDLDLGETAREQAFRRVVFNIAAMNRDDHTKNVAFLMPENGAWQLAPAFDITHAHNPSGRWTGSHQMSLEGKRNGIGLDDLYRFADKHRVPGYRSLVADVLEAVRHWPDFAAEAGVDAQTTARIADDLAGVGLA
jgi:serine/threonine-protein kinase HipA